MKKVKILISSIFKDMIVEGNNSDYSEDEYNLEIFQSAEKAIIKYLVNYPMFFCL